MRFKKLPDLDYIKSIFDYDPETGIFTWKVKLSAKQYIGDIAGSIDGKGYRILRIRKSNYKAHRIAYYFVTGCDPRGQQIDHINRIKDDNSFSNLRLCSNSVNQHNRGLTGVHLHKASGKYTAVVTHNGVKHYLGLFINVFDALAAYYTKKNNLIAA